MIKSCATFAARFAFVIGVLAVSAATPAFAQPTKVFVGSTGSDANDGSRASPKRSFQAAHDAVAAGGGIVVLDTAGYGALSIGKSVAITVPPGVSGFITVATGVDAITVNAKIDDAISIRGLILEGGGATANDGAGIRVSKAGLVIIEDTSIRGFGTGVNVVASGNGARVLMRGGLIRDIGTGVAVRSFSSASRQDVVLSDLSIDGASVAGVRAEGFPNAAVIASVTAVRATITASAVAIETGRNGSITVDGCALVSNALAFNKVANAGAIKTRGNNTLDRNTTTINSANTLTPLDPL